MQREGLIVGVLALIAAWIVVGAAPPPNYTDAFYHYNAAARLANGEGLTDVYLWTYVGLPDHYLNPAAASVTETPSHLYWMPMTTLLTALALMIGWVPGAAHPIFVVMFAAVIGISYFLGRKLGGTRRHAVIAALLTVFSGFFAPMWGTVDTFTPYAFFGALCLVCLGLGVERGAWGWFAAAGVLAGFGHLTRADGLLLLGVGWLVIVITSWQAKRVALRSFVVLTGAYLLIMLPWFARMMSITGAPLPVGGVQGAWFFEYNDLFRYPPDSSAGEFFANGGAAFVGTRWTGFINNLLTFIGVEGLIFLTPLMLIGLWQRHRERFVWGFALYALGLHAAMTLVFPLPGYRGGLFHSAAALVPWWAAFAIVGLDAVVDWVGKRRRRWQPRRSKAVFSAALVVLAAVITVSMLVQSPNKRTTLSPLQQELREKLPPDARLLVNDPAQVYYSLGMGGAVLPNETYEVIPILARNYGLTHVLIEGVTDMGSWYEAYGVPAKLFPLLDNTPSFLTEIPMTDPTVRLYQIEVD